MSSTRDVDVPTAIYRALMAQIPEGAVICTTAGDVLDANPLAARLLGVDPAILEGLPFPTALEEAGLEPEKPPFEVIREAALHDHPLLVGPIPLESGAALELHSFRVSTQVLVLVLIRQTAAAAAPVPGPAGLGTDLLETFSQGALMLSPDGNIRTANDAAVGLLGTSRSELEGSEIRDWMSGINPAGMADRFLTQTKSSGRWNGVLKLQKGSELQEVGLTARRTQEGILLTLADRGRRQGPATGWTLPIGDLMEAFSELWARRGAEPLSCEAILEAAGDALDYDLACLERYHQDRAEFEIAALDARIPCRVQAGVVLPDAASSSGKARETGDVLLLPDLAQERRYEDVALFRDFSSGMKLPLVSGDRCLGVLSLWSRETAFFQSRYAQAASLVAALLVTALQDEELSSLRAAIPEHEETARIARAALDRVDQGVLGVDPDGRILWTNRTAERLTGRTREELGGSLVGLVLARGERETIGARIGRGDWSGKTVLALEEDRELRVALTISGTAGDFHRGSPITLVFRECAEQEALEASTRRLERQMGTAGRLLALDPDAEDLAEFLNGYAAALQEFLPFQEAQIFVPSQEGEAMVLQASADGSRGRMGQDRYYPREDSLLGKAGASGQTISLPDLSEADGEDASSLREAGYRSALILPLGGGDASESGPWPVLILLSTSPEGFPEEDVHGLAALLGPVRLALKRWGPADRTVLGGQSP